MTQKEERRARVLLGVEAKQLNMVEAVTLLGVSERQVWRLLGRYRTYGLAGLVHGNRGKTPRHATSEVVQQEIVRLATSRYVGANSAHLAELLAEREGLELSRWTVRRIVRRAGLPSPRRRRPAKHRSRRERYPMEGMLLQVDGSRHAWLEDRGPWLTLVGAVDDATGTVPWALFREQEDAQGYLELLRGILEHKGIPEALYADRHSIFTVSRPEGVEEQLTGERAPTQVGRALAALGIQLVLAFSPQAKGRIERLWQTFQDRLVMELRLAGARTIEEANHVLRSFLPRFNAHFGVAPRLSGTAYRSVPPGLDLGGVLCFCYQRTVAADNTVTFGGQAIQVLTDQHRVSYARARVEVQERLDGQIVVAYRGRVLASMSAPAQPVTLRARKGKRLPLESSLGSEVRAHLEPKGPGLATPGLAPEDARVPAGIHPLPKPAKNHPWRKSAILTKSLHPKH